MTSAPCAPVEGGRASREPMAERANTRVARASIPPDQGADPAKLALVDEQLTSMRG